MDHFLLSDTFCKGFRSFYALPFQSIFHRDEGLKFIKFRFCIELNLHILVNFCIGPFQDCVFAYGFLFSQHQLLKKSIFIHWIIFFCFSQILLQQIVFIYLGKYAHVSSCTHTYIQAYGTIKKRGYEFEEPNLSGL